MKDISKKSTSIKYQINKFLIGAIITLIIICTGINFSFKQVLLSNQYEYTAITSERLTSQLNLLYDRLDNFSLELSSEAEVQQLLIVDISEKYNYVRHLSDKIAYYKILEPSIIDISLISENLTYSSLYSREKLLELKSNNEKNIYSFLGTENSDYITVNNDTKMLLFGRNIFKNGENIGMIVISIDPIYFQLDANISMNSYYLLADDDEILLTLNNDDEKTNDIWSIWKANNTDLDEDYINSKSLIIQSIYSEKLNCYQISALNTKQVDQNMNMTRNFVWSIFFLVILYIFLILFNVNYKVVNPLNEFHTVIKEIRSQQKRTIEMDYDLKACAEILELELEFSNMMEDIEKLNKKIFETSRNLYEMEYHKQKAELNFMKSQVDPHFLYNTLELVRRMANDIEHPVLAQIAIDMGNIFRYSAKGSSIVKFSDEISIVKSYIRIQQTRFKGKMQVYYSIPPDILELKIPKMLLQPIVENAIYHGIEPKSTDGKLFIGAYTNDNVLFITIKDTGIGIDENKLKKIRKRLSAKLYDTSKYVGIINTNARIQLQYGSNNYGITIESEINDGTTVTLNVPITTLEDN
ncbi:MAG: sensor histidine kinase [Lachnospirales bacterium]